jgi:hypothetical protein
MKGVGLLLYSHGNTVLKRNANALHKTQINNLYAITDNLLEYLIFIVGTRIRIF